MQKHDTSCFKASIELEFVLNNSRLYEQGFPSSSDKECINLVSTESSFLVFSDVFFDVGCKKDLGATPCPNYLIVED